MPSHGVRTIQHTTPKGAPSDYSFAVDTFLIRPQTTKFEYESAKIFWHIAHLFFFSWHIELTLTVLQHSHKIHHRKNMILSNWCARTRVYILTHLSFLFWMMNNAIICPIQFGVMWAAFAQISVELWLRKTKKLDILSIQSSLILFIHSRESVSTHNQRAAGLVNPS